MDSAEHTPERRINFSAAHANADSHVVALNSANGNEFTLISNGLIVRGEVSGTDPLVIEGRVEGNIRLDGGRVTVGRNGYAAANIVAREVVVQGKVQGNISATDRVDVRAEGSVVGDLSSPRVSIEDGAFFKGGIDIRQTAQTRAATTPATATKVIA